MTGLRRRWHQLLMRPERGAGGESLELVIIAPILLLIIVIGIGAGRASIGNGRVDQAAAAAARSASLERDPVVAQEVAIRTANQSLADAGASCGFVQVDVDTSGFRAARGVPASVTVTVVCQVEWSDLAIPGWPGSTTITGTGVSPLDVNRERAPA